VRQIAPRGEIVDRHGAPLVQNRQATVIQISPRSLPDTERESAVLWAQVVTKRLARPKGHRGPGIPIPPIPTREIRAAGPGSDHESLRTAYLELLKLSLCDLAGSGTTSVTWTGEDRVFSRELRGEALKLRAGGVDWPLHGLTMVGLKRLDDLQSCVESVVQEGVSGDLIEAGAWRGGASILMRATLDSLGDRDRTVWVADSFQGFPAPDAGGFPEDPKLDDLSRVDFLAAPLEEVREHFARFGCDGGVNFVPGFFEETMPDLRGRRWSLVRIDADTYKSTWVTLEALYPGLSTGGYLVVDDYPYIEACRRAVDDFRRDRGISEPIEQFDWMGSRWRRESEPTAEEGQQAPANQAPSRRARAVPRSSESPIPSARELRLEHELAAIRERLRAAEGEVERLRASSVRRSMAWLRHRMRGGG
jgi:O-methyltransferase